MRANAVFALIFCLFLVMPLVGLLVPDMMINRDVPAVHVSAAPQFKNEGDTLYVVWEDNRNGQKDIYFNASPDGGHTWMAGDIRLDVGTPPGASASLSPRIAVSGDSVYVVWQDNRRKRDPNAYNDYFAGDIYLNYSRDRGTTWQSLDFRVNRTNDRGHFNPHIAVSGDTVYVLWELLYGTYSVTNADLLFNASQDKGLTWQPADTRIDDPRAGVYHNTHNPALAASERYVTIAWEEFYGVSFLGDLYTVHSDDRGLTWKQSVKVRPDEYVWDNSDHPQLAAEGSIFHLAWLDARDGVENVFYSRSNDGGATWESAGVRISTNDPSGTGYCYEPKIAIDGSHVCVVWRDNRNDPNQDEYWFNNMDDIYGNFSDDGGTTWRTEDIRINIGDPPGVHHAASPTPVLNGDEATIVWRDWRNGRSDIYANLFKQGGLGTPVRLDAGDAPGVSESDAPRPARTSAAVHAVWIDFRGNGKAGDVYYNRFSFPGLPLLVEAERVIDRSLFQSRSLTALTIRMNAEWMAAQGTILVRIQRRTDIPGSSWMVVEEINSTGSTTLFSYDVLPSGSLSAVYRAVAVDASGQEIAFSPPLIVPLISSP